MWRTRKSELLTVTVNVKHRQRLLRRRVRFNRFFDRIQSKRVRVHELAQVVRKFGPAVITGHPRFALLDPLTRQWVRQVIKQTANWRLG